MRNRIILGLVLILSITMSAQNYSFFENDIRFDESSTTVTLTHFGEYVITEEFGFTDYVSVENNDLGSGYGQVLLGVNYKGLDYMTFSVFAGKETFTNDVRLGGYISYINGDKLSIYGFYQKNVEETYDSEWYDLRLRYAIISGDVNSVYVGGRYMRAYGVGLTIGARQKLTDKINMYISYATYYNTEVGTDDSDPARWTPTLSLNIELF